MKYEYLINIITTEIGNQVKNSNEHIRFYNINDKK